MFRESFCHPLIFVFLPQLKQCLSCWPLQSFRSFPMLIALGSFSSLTSTGTYLDSVPPRTGPQCWSVFPTFFSEEGPRRLLELYIVIIFLFFCPMLPSLFSPMPAVQSTNDTTRYHTDCVASVLLCTLLYIICTCLLVHQLAELELWCQFAWKSHSFNVISFWHFTPLP